MTDLSHYEQTLRATQRSPLGVMDILKFLYRYGYFSDIVDKLKDKTILDIAKDIRTNMPEFREAIRRFREFYELAPGDDADEHVQSAMLIPRCAVPDFFPAAEKGEYAAIQGYQGRGYWPISSMAGGVKYFIESNVPNKDSIIEGANRWNRVSGINLVQVVSKSGANIVITFKRIDGGGGTLALGWFPMQNSATQQVEQRLDSSENWTFKFQAEVSCHEFGHNLGWDHKNGNSVMHPYASGQWPEPQPYDIGVAQNYYGKPIEPPKPDPLPPVTPPTIPTEPDEPDSPTNPYSRAKLFLPHPETGELGEYFVLPKTDYGGL
jgi:hypothetical protein